jgi:quercetin dioxygenase-like cupin family protein
MSNFKVDFPSMAWDDGRPGVRHKVYREGARLLRLVEFDTAEGFDGWCEQGHIGFVLEGGVTIDFDGEVISFSKGDGLFIPAGKESIHRAVSIVPGTKLIMVEDA